MTITGGKSGTTGGGIENAGTLTLTNCTLSGNSASHSGGGIENFLGTLTLTACTLSGNSAGGSGGGIDSAFSTLTLTNCTLSGNSAFNGFGGGICSVGTLTLTACTLSGNSAFNGGGIFNGPGQNVPSPVCTLINCTLSGNSAIAGGGIRSQIGLLTLTNCTLSGNSASSSGGGILSFGGTLTNTIVANSPDGGDLSVSGGFAGSHNLIEDGSGGLADTITGDPLLGSLANNGGPTQTHALLPGSPAIGKGSNAMAVDSNGNPLAFDQRGPGFPRIMGGTVDIGAFEDQNSSPAANDDTATTNEDTAVVIAVLGNDSDPDGDPLTITVVGAPLHGVATLNANGTITYTPGQDFNSPDSFTYTISDGRGGTATATVHLTVTPVNDAPVLTVPGAQSTAEDLPVTIAGMAVADVDVLEGTGEIEVTLSVGSGTLRVSITAAGGLTAGQVAGDGTGTVVLRGPIAAVNATLAAGVTYLGALNFTGTDTLTVTADDLGNTGAGGPRTDVRAVGIRVLSPAEQLAELRAKVRALSNQGALNEGQANSLLVKLDQAVSQLAKGNTKVAYNVVRAFRNEVLALIAAGVLSPAQGDPLVEAADRLRQGLLIGGGF